MSDLPKSAGDLSPGEERAVGSGESPTAEIVRAWLVNRLSEELGIEPHQIEIQEPFASYGLGSVQAIGLTGDLESWLGRRLAPTLAYEYPTIEALARHLTGEPHVSDAASFELRIEQGAQTEPIAIIGIGCRFPGAQNPEAFWRLLRDGVNAITEVPPDRWNLDAFYDADPATPGKINSRWGGFIEKVDQFDYHFFGISPREASRTDPQQRLLLEIGWEALEDAGQIPERLQGTRTGVFIGISTNDYSRIQWSDPAFLDAYAGTGNASSIAANRLSYLFDFRGPSIAVDTACSSSLVAVHMACCSLWNGESTLALAGGVNLILSPLITINFTKAGVLSPDGACKSFDQRANGYVRSEGAGIVILKPLSRALADGDSIYAVIRGSAINQDGRTNGLMAPNREAQEAVLLEAYRRAGISPGQVDYVEAHGSGTSLGDQIEAKALGAALATGRPPGSPCAIGSVKTNIGHLEAAAGVAGLIKVVLSLKHRAIPPSLHFQQPNPDIPFERLPLRVQQSLAPWPVKSGPALAGVSSFGFGGTNAHVVLEEAPPRQEVDERGKDAASRIVGAQLLPISARSPEALRSLVLAYLDSLRTDGNAFNGWLQDVCHTASVRRSHHNWRLALLAHSTEELIEQLEAFLQGETRYGISSGRRIPGRQRKLVLVFPGQGPQWVGMGRELLKQEPVFREALERCEQAMRPHVDWSLLAMLSAGGETNPRAHEIEVIQPTLFALQVGLAALWRSWGVEPDAVVGYSMGEVAAAHVAGALTLEDAARVICCRSRLLQRVSRQGAMAVVELSLEQAGRVLAGHEGRVSIAVSSSPTSTVLSGDEQPLREILDELQRRDIFCRRVNVDVASHSPQMDPLRDDLSELLKGLRPQPASLLFFSTVTGHACDGLMLDAAYWVRNLRQPVLFSQVVQRLAETDHEVFLEISPHPTLLKAIQQGLYHAGKEGVLLPSLRREEEERAVMLGSLGALYTLGQTVNWRELQQAQGCRARLPSYPWQRERCWLDLEESSPGFKRTRDWTSRNGAKTHPLLGHCLKLAHPSGSYVWEHKLDSRSQHYLDDHRVQEAIVMPGTAYVEMALAAATEAFGAEPRVMSEIEFHNAIILPEGASLLIQVVLSPCADGQASFRIYSQPEGAEQTQQWTLRTSGKIHRDEKAPEVTNQARPELVRSRCSEEISGEDFYLKLRDKGNHWGPLFQGIARLWRGDGESLGQLRVPEVLEPEIETRQFHPAVLDACGQVLAAIKPVANTDGSDGVPFVLSSVDRFLIYGRPRRRMWSHARLRPGADQTGNVLKGDIQVFDEAGEMLLEFLGCSLHYLDTRNIKAENLDDWLYELQWQPAPRLEGQQTFTPPLPGGRWLVFADSAGIALAMADLLAAKGERSVLVSPGEAFERVDEERFRIDPRRTEDLRQLLSETLGSDQSRYRGVVHLWSLEALPLEETTLALLEEAQVLGCGSVLRLVQELAQGKWPSLPQLWLVTQGAQPAGAQPAPLAVAQAPLWGLGRTIAIEHFDLWRAMVDLDPEATAEDAAKFLCEEMWSSDREDQLACRQGQRYVARLARLRQPSGPSFSMPWRIDGSYLITGGLGDLGLRVARRMVEQGARRLILLGRTKLPPRSSWNQVAQGSRLSYQINAIRELEALGASIHLASVDVADESQLTAFLEGFRDEGWPPIRGVMHTAGVVELRTLLELDEAAMRAVMRPKVMGGWLLHRLLRDDPLDFFVLFSSATSLLSSPRLGHYAAANAFLDALAHHRRSQNQPALSINWALWGEVGVAARYLQTGHTLLRGVESFSPDQGLDVLCRLLQQDATEVGVMRVDWAQWFQLYGDFSRSPLLSALAREQTEGVLKARQARTKDRLTRDALVAVEPEQRQRLLEAYLCPEVARILGLSASRLDVEASLSNLGIDSLMAVELKNRIEADIGVVVPLVKFLEGPSLAQLIALALDQLEAAASVSSESSALTGPDDPTLAEDEEQRLLELERLSDEEVDKMLRELLASKEHHE